MRAEFLLLVVLAPFLAGCAGQGQADPAGPDGPTPSVKHPGSSFEVTGLTIRPIADANRTTLYEDDGIAVVRYVVQQPPAAPRETAFVTYLLNGRIADAQQITLDPGQAKTYERLVDVLRAGQDIKIEVRAGASIERAGSTVRAWPRAGEDALTLGPLTIRADYGLLQQDRRALVNLTLAHDGSTQRFEDFRMKMVCLDAQGAFVTTSSADIQPPAPGEPTGIDVTIDDCRHERYGMEFKATGDAGTLVGRLLLVPVGWTPTPEP